MTPEQQQVLRAVVEASVVVVSVLVSSEKLKVYFKKFRQKFQPHHSQTKVNIQRMLDEMRARTGAVRSCIWMLSNGQNALNGYSYKYANMVYESIGVGMSEVQNDIRRIPVENFADVLSAVQKSDWIFIGTPNSPYPILNAVYRQYGYSCAVESKFVNSNVDMGFISVSWSNQDKPTKEQLRDIKETTALIYSEIKKLN